MALCRPAALANWGQPRESSPTCYWAGPSTPKRFTARSTRSGGFRWTGPTCSLTSTATKKKIPHHNHEHRPLTGDRSEVNQLQRLEHDGPRARHDPTRAPRRCPAPDLRLPVLAAAAPAPRVAGPRLPLPPPPPPVPPHRGRRDQGGTRARRRRIGGRRRCRRERRRQRPEGRREGRGRGRGRGREGREDGAGPVHVAETHSRLRRARRSWWCNGIYEEWKPEILGCRRHISPGPVLCPHSTPSETCLCIVDRFRYIGCASVSDGVALQEVQEDIPSRCRVPCIPGHGRRLLPRDLA